MGRNFNSIRDVGRMVINEVPTTSDNIVYTVSKTVLPNTFEVFVNGILQDEGEVENYTYVSNDITFTTALEATDDVLVNYRTLEDV